jgi:glycosyltransferase involved in cell wall biosynthesis
MNQSGILDKLSYMKRNLGSHSHVSKNMSHKIDKKTGKMEEKNKKNKKSKKNKKNKKNKNISPMEKALSNKYDEIINNSHKYTIENTWIANSHAIVGIKYICYLGSTGYADASKGYIRGLVENGVKVYVEPIRYCDEKSNQTLTADDNLLAVCLHNKNIKYNSVIIHSIPNEWKTIVERERSINPNVKIYGLTVWETDRVDPGWMSMIRSVSLDGLIVPSHWNQQIFIKTAKKLKLSKFPPVHVCHHSITDRIESSLDTSLDRNKLYGTNIKLALLCIGTWTCRKGIDESIHAYLRAFKNRHDVVLYLKTSCGSYNDVNSHKLEKKLHNIRQKYEQPPKIILDTQLRSDDYINTLIKYSDIYLSLCNSEGVGLGACQSALKGKIIVMTGFGGQTEYIEESNWVNYQLDVVNVTHNFAEWINPPQQWAYPSIQHAVKILQNIDHNKDIYLQKSNINREFILNKFSYKQIGQKMKNIVMTPS